MKSLFLYENEKICQRFWFHSVHPVTNDFDTVFNIGDKISVANCFYDYVLMELSEYHRQTAPVSIAVAQRHDYLYADFYIIDKKFVLSWGTIAYYLDKVVKIDADSSIQNIERAAVKLLEVVERNK